MSKANETSGRFYWFELMAGDVERAKGFYGELFGWSAKSMDMGPMGTYWVLSAGEKQIAGVVKAESKEKSGWLAYTTVKSVDEATKIAKGAGGTELVPPTDIPTIGRFSIVADTEGAVIAPFRPLEESEEPKGHPGLGEFCWSELLTHAPDKATAFYTKVFGWATEGKDMGPMGTYTIFKRGDVQAGGAMKAMDPKAPPMWLHYVVVENVDTSYARVEKLGGKQIVPPMDIPGIGRSAVVTDPDGAMIALFKGG